MIKVVVKTTAACLLFLALPSFSFPLPDRRLWSWPGFGRSAQHTAISPVRAQTLAHIRWQTSVDLDPQYSGTDLPIHYGSPLITGGNTVLLPVKTGAQGGFRVEARNGDDGSLIWTLLSDYTLPPHQWIPAFGPVLTPLLRVWLPGAGGTVYYRDEPDSPGGAQGQIAFYGLDSYRANPALFDANVIINTPLTADRNGAIYFGFLVLNNMPGGFAGGLTSGIARIGPDGGGSWIAVTDAASDPSVTEAATNSAFALSGDFGTLYACVKNGSVGYLVALDSLTLQPRSRVLLLDPATGLNALLDDNSSASPTVGLDGDVYFGVLESTYENHGRGWLLHFDGELLQSKIPGAFGWDATPALVSREAVPSYRGNSSYLLVTKYNDYVEEGGNGLNRLAILDPGSAEADPVTGVPVMQEVLTIAGPTPDGPPPIVKEWCVNSVAVDSLGRAVFAINEDGNLYRWDLTKNALTQSVMLTSGQGEAYTPTVIGVDGTVYAIANGTLFAVGQ
jgi:hypothetical protein